MDYSVGKYHDPNSDDAYFETIFEAMNAAADRALKDDKEVIAVWDVSETVFIYTGGEVFART